MLPPSHYRRCLVIQWNFQPTTDCVCNFQVKIPFFVLDNSNSKRHARLTRASLLLQFDFRNGALRKKFDTLKYTLKKMETTLYEQSLTENLGFRKETDAPAPDAEGGGDDGMGAEQ
jgi:hypothetical protein